MKPRLLDLFCGAGGAAVGYARAGFEVVGVDINRQPHYPFEFHQADAMSFPLSGFDVIHASPPCQRYSILTAHWTRDTHPDLIAPVRERLKAAGAPYVIETVAGGRREMSEPLMLCGRMFGLGVERHRYFDISPRTLLLVPECDHSEYPVLITGTHRRAGVKRTEYSVAECRAAAGISWMTRKEIDEAIPPAYTEFIGRHLAEFLAVAA